MKRGERPDRFFSAQWWEPVAYRETFVILGEVLRDPNAVARWLAPISPEVALDVILRNGEGLTLTDVTPETKTALLTSAETLTSERDPRGRAAAYRVLGVFDADHRPGIGLRADGLPDIVWCSVKGGSFTMGADPEAFADTEVRPAAVADFRISKYPVTYKQFQAFIDAPDGYRDPTWWDGLHADGLKRQKKGPAKQALKFWNHPRENVSWYETMAFCRWLSVKFGYEVRLPTEAEWERAARGTDGWFYPYGNEFDPGKGNTEETGIGQTSAVEIFPDGESPYGVLDMSGNVWEWTLTAYDTRTFDNTNSNTRRTVRGGSWRYNQDGARAASRIYSTPDNRHDGLGFRVCYAAPVP
ncbi:MAG: formylglycine-generating enzyme family protein [Aggregatilineales bacterium]